LEGIIQFIETLNPAYIYITLFLAAFFENIIPPIPGDVVVITGAYLVGTNNLNFTLTYIIITSGSFLGFMGLYFLGFFFSDKILTSKKLKFLKSQNFKKGEYLFKKYGLKIVLLNRFLSGTRSVISFISGMYKLNTKLVSLFSFISCILWNGLLIFLGTVIGKNRNEIIDFIKLYNEIVFVIIIILIIVVVKFKILDSRKKI